MITFDCCFLPEAFFRVYFIVAAYRQQSGFFLLTIIIVILDKCKLWMARLRTVYDALYLPPAIPVLKPDIHSRCFFKISFFGFTKSFDL